ncbi:MAG: carbamoyltransferase HypF [Thermodesulfovibrionales bacterium]|nr:carbamoyltransferase HypF [Thermodesulfovibrionales bacterium]
MRVTLTGVVQGVGFRPHVYNLASLMGLKGYVLNSAGGLTIEVEGGSIEEFVQRLTSAPPPLAEIKEVGIEPLPPLGYHDFSIRESTDGGGLTIIPPDIATCPDCLREVSDPSDRRYRYPFTNCTNCGPRYTIARGIPYDRANTTMSAFRMCPDCEAEYHDPGNRRFHAQPNACPSCGPSLKLLIRGEVSAGDPLSGTIKLLKEGRIVAVKGIGGFHLACDALNEDSVKTLRERKRKSNKPFAIMCPDVETARGFCLMDEVEEEALLSPRRPIVLLDKGFISPIAPSVSPSNMRLGVMLPYSPLHFLLFEEGGFNALVMTSGNLSEEPIVIDNGTALQRLSGLADAFLLHDRDIFMRADDSVLMVAGGRPRLVRRARGYAPLPVSFHLDSGEVLSVGGELKNTFTLLKGKSAILSQHIGNMENDEALGFFEESLRNLKAIYRIEPKAVAHDLHPDYMTTIWAGRSGLKAYPVQHHHAHIASSMAENGLTGKVIGVSLDGMGLGPDGSVWGGEFMTADYGGFKRMGHFKCVPMPGGDMAVKEPWRMAVSYIYDAFGDDAFDIIKGLGVFRERDVEGILNMIKKGVNSPLTSSAGRLFDAVSSMLGLCQSITYEAEAAIALEGACQRPSGVYKPSSGDDRADNSYPLNISSYTPMVVDFSLTVIGIINDIKKCLPTDIISGRFHSTVAEAVGRTVERISGLTGLKRVVLSGGVFQNRLLLDLALDALNGRGLEVYSHEKVPTNDGGISLGQAASVSYRILSGEI